MVLKNIPGTHEHQRICYAREKKIPSQFSRYSDYVAFVMSRGGGEKKIILKVQVFVFFFFPQ